MSDLKGLSGEEARRRLVLEGANRVPQPRGRLGQIVLRTLSEPMILLLLIACGLYLSIGEPHEGLVLGLMVCVTITVTLRQQQKSEHALRALRDLSSPRALVLRDGRLVRIDGGEVVRGDVLMVAEGERVAADAVLLRGQNLKVDESLLTGESWPVNKAVSGGEIPGAVARGEALPFLWSGTLVVQGEGVAEVTATGRQTELGKLGASLTELDVQDTPLQRGNTRTIRVWALVALATSLLVTVLYGAMHGAWLSALLAGIAVSMALLPEELPVIMTIFPAIGAWRLARTNVLTRRLAAIEALGCVSVLCVDKTGTLTENRMRVEQLHAAGVTLRLDREEAVAGAPFEQLIRFASLASKQRAYDPMETALHAMAGGIREDEPLREYPLSAERSAMSQVWADDAGDASVVACKGAPEAVADLCQMSGPARHAIGHGCDGGAGPARNRRGGRPPRRSHAARCADRF